MKSTAQQTKNVAGWADPKIIISLRMARPLLTPPLFLPSVTTSRLPAGVKNKARCTGHCAKKHSGQCAGRTQSFARQATQFLHRLRNGMCVWLDDSGLQPPWVDVTPRGLSARLLHLHLQGDTTDASLHRNPWSVSISLTKRSFCKALGAPQPCVSLSALSTETRRHLPPEHSRSLHPRLNT